MFATFLFSEEQVESHSIRQEVEEEGIRSGDEEVEVEVTLWRLEAGARLRERMGRVGDLRGSGPCSNVDCRVVLCSAPLVSQSVFTITEKAPTRAFFWLKALSHLRHN